MTRPLAGAGGRGAVLRTVVDSLVAAGHVVRCAVVGGPAVPEPVPGAASVHRLPDVALLDVLTGRHARRRGLRSWNERLYWSPAAAAAVRRLVAEHAVDLVVADGVRLAAHAEDSGAPWFVDLDDLLSERYELWRTRRMDLHQLLGHRRPGGPAATALRAVPVRRLLRTEARALREREVDLARRAPGVSLVSGVEAARLAERSGAAVRALPMAVSTAVHRDWHPGGLPAPLDRRLVFPGSLTAFANEEAVRWWAEELEPALRAHGLRGWQLHVFGEVPAQVAARVRAPSVVLRGAMPRERLHAELVRHALLLAPQREALGLTVKVVEAAALGLVPVTTPQGASGLGAEPGRDLLLFGDGDDLARVLGDVERWAREDPAALSALASRARAWAASSFSPAVLTGRWARVVEDLVPGAPASPASAPAGAVVPAARRTPHPTRGGTR
ncbi:glycosyltransferase [Kineococcus sp. SYSU DK004]|uniref:glycosyltransferase n=1 Tax=Kineococcus sp. SYSU DK004 TaxID=3383125 RepID=UPI003D7EC85D